jgi:quercetin dioxygenase-like cupin family protein
MVDAVTAAPHAYKVLLENDRVRVLEYRGAPGTKAEMHSHPDLVAVALRGGKVRFTLASGETQDAELADGEAGFFDATDHMTENAGSSEIHLVLVELK